MPLLSYKCGFWLLVAVITLLMVKEVLLPEYDTRGSKAAYNSYQMGIVLNRTEVIAENSRSDSIPHSSRYILFATNTIGNVVMHKYNSIIIYNHTCNCACVCCHELQYSCIQRNI